MIYERKTRGGTVRYVVKVYVRTTTDGKKIDKHVGTFGKKKDAKIAEAQALQELHLAANDETIEQFAERWLEDYPRDRASTMRTHRQAIKAFVRLHGRRKPDTITKKEARAWALGHPSTHASLRAMWADMETEEVATANPFANLRLKQSKGRADITPPTAAELERLVTAARDDKPGEYGELYASMIVFAAYTGIRRGELCVLEWEDVDLEHGRVVISKTLSDDREIQPPKNGKTRTIVLPPVAADALRRIKPKREAAGLIFTTPNGRRFSKSTWHYHWHPVRIEAGLRDLDWHVLRHFCATYLIETLRLAPHVAAKQLGHSDAGELIMRLYAHPDEDGLLAEIAAAYETAQAGDQPSQRPALRVLEAAS